ncbi:MAG TPA: hypothetical protein PKC45_19095, partial [Gemmatales bacterium]|nr:hypothetical protein [Gemmatales bacterium]
VLLRGVGFWGPLFLLFFLFWGPRPVVRECGALPCGVIPADVRPDWLESARQAHASLGTRWNDLANEASKWLGSQVFGAEVIIQPTGSGDTLRAYMGCLWAALIAGVLSLLWSLVDFSGRTFALGHGLARFMVRWFLVVMMLTYGLAKVFPLQFPPPTSLRLEQPLGDFSPMGLLWVFMGVSQPYTVFTGAIEVLGALLLTTRRTTLLGALVTSAAMTQVLALNLCYDVPVKLYSAHYLLMAGFLIAPDLPRLWRLFVVNQPVAAAQLPPLGGRIWLDRTALAFRTLFVAALVGLQVTSMWTAYRQMTDGPTAPLQGSWQMETLTINEAPAEAESPLHWNRLDVTSRGFLFVHLPDQSKSIFAMSFSEDGSTLKLNRPQSTEAAGELTVERPEEGVLILSGKIGPDTLHGRFQRLRERTFELTTRSFHWVQEVPYNR